MQSGPQQGGGGAGRSTAVAPPVRSGSSAAASPSSSSSGFDSLQQHQQQQIAFRQSIQQQQQQQQQQQLRKSEGDDTLLAYQAGNVHGVTGGSSFPSSSTAFSMPQHSRKFIELSQQGAATAAQAREEIHIKSHGMEQTMINPIHQAYLHAFQAAQQKSLGNMQPQQQAKMGMVGPPGKDQDIRTNSLKMQELMSIQAANQSANQTQAAMFKRPVEHFAHTDKQSEQGQTSSADQCNEPKPPQAAIGQLQGANIMRTLQSQQPQPSMQNIKSNQYAMTQLQAMQAWALEHNIDLSHPANASLISQIYPLLQSKIAAMQKPNENNAAMHSSRIQASKPQITSSSPVGSENSAHGNSLSDASGPVLSKNRPTHPMGSFPSSGTVSTVNSNNNQMQQLAGRDNPADRAARPPIAIGNGMQSVHPPLASSANQGMDHSARKNAEILQMQYLRQLQQLNRSNSQAPGTLGEGSSNNPPSQASSMSQIPHQRLGFTKQQLHVLKAQILAFRRLKRGESSLPQEVLMAIVPPPLESDPSQALSSSGMRPQDKNAGKNVEEHTQAPHLEINEKPLQPTPSIKGQELQKEELIPGDEKTPKSHMQGMTGSAKEPVRAGSVGKEEHRASTSVKPEQDAELVNQNSNKADAVAERGQTLPSQGSAQDATQTKKTIQASATPQKDTNSTRKYYGPLFDFPHFIRRNDSFGSSTFVNSTNSLMLAYDVKDLLFEEGIEMLKKKRADNLKKIGGLLAVNLERKRIKPDLFLRLQIEQKKLQLLDHQTRLRDEVEQQQKEIMAMPDRPYRKFVRMCERQRMELARQVQATQKVMRDRQLKSIFQWRKKLLETHWAIRDARTSRNRGVAKYHEKMLREFSKRKDEDRTKRMEALKNNDVDRYREILLQQQTNVPGDAAQRYAVLSSFLSQTEEYLHKLGGKIASAKNHQEVEEAANAAAAAARLQGLSEEEAKSAASCAREEVMIRNKFSEMNAPRENSSVNKYYNLAHAVSERVVRQPSMLRAGTLRDYQLVGLQWMLSLYNNKLNGILADEMGLGKTVQVMALVAYLMEFKGNYGPHLIIVPNAVLVNWKSELHNWLPSASCIFYVGGKDQRSKLFSQEVCAMKFNVLVTTYEFVMYDRPRLSRIDWKYIIIDEAQRMKDRESVLARDLDRYRCQRRLLLTGTPLQNDLKELWSLLNLLLPEVFDNRKAFQDWFSKPFQKDGSSESAEDDWLETEKKVIIIHRLHQILEPFMLRRRVEDVEGALPPKISIVLKCRMSAIQGAIYDWIKSTGTIRVDPEDEQRRLEKNPMYQIKKYKNLNNRCMELRKACNHPLLNYPYFSDFSKDFLVRSCGKLWILDRILIKLQRAGHRVLLFSTMTKLLDILEEYLQWRRLIYRRIDGTTSLEDRESAIVDFNSHNSDCFIFLLSIRAAGRGLNLQSADTVIIYDPDPNPQNEEQAVARAHRIGQKREVKVIYMEAVVDKISSYQKEDELKSGGSIDFEDDLVGKDRYIGSIESLIRNNIQQYKIDMADEVINAGRFDQRTTHEERRLTLETLLHDEERYQENVHDVPSLQEVNRMIARSEEEVELFDQMDEEFDWTEEMIKYNQVPKWLRAGTREVNAVIANLSKKPPKDGFVGNFGVESSEMADDVSPPKTERKRGRPRGSSSVKNYSMYLDDENGEDSDASSEERNGYSLPEEEGEIGEYEDEEFSGAVGVPSNNKDQSEEEDPACDGSAYQFVRGSESGRGNHIYEEAGSSGSSSGSRRLAQTAVPTSSLQKFGSLSALDARPGSVTRRMAEELEEGEIAGSGDSHMDVQQSGSWIHEREDVEDGQVLQPKIKRKRSIRHRPRPTFERPDEKANGEKLFSQRGNVSQFPSSMENDYETPVRVKPELEEFSEPVADRHERGDSLSKQKRNLPSRKVPTSSKVHVTQKPTKSNSVRGPSVDSAEQSRDNWNAKAVNTGGPGFTGSKMSDIVQRKCKNVTSKFQRRIEKDGHQIAPILTEFWKSEHTSYMAANNLLDLRRIDQRVDRLEYNGMMDYVSDVQLMLKSAAQYCGCSQEVRLEARKLQDIFFEIMKIAFPGTDFRDVRNNLVFSSPGSAISHSPRQGATNHTKRHKMITEVDLEQSPTRQLQITSGVANADLRAKSHPSKPLKESRLASGSSSRDPGGPLPDEAPWLTHPGDLVICKKKRKDRDKNVMLNSRSGPVSPVSTPRGIRGGHGGSGRTHQPPASQQLVSNSQGWAQQGNDEGGSSIVKDAQWAKPVKRMRTDAGKRRPSHL